MTLPVLPEQFADISHLVAQWARPSENERSEIRWAASKEDFKSLYDEMMPRLDAVLAYLSQYPVDDMPDGVRNLFMLSCAFAEASPHHELYGGSSAVPYSFDARRFVRSGGDGIS